MNDEIALINAYELGDWIRNVSTATSQKADEYLEKGDFKNAFEMAGKLKAYVEVLSYMQKMTAIPFKVDKKGG